MTARLIGTLTVDGVTVEKWAALPDGAFARFAAVIRGPDGVRRHGWEVERGVAFDFDRAAVEWART